MRYLAMVSAKFVMADVSLIIITIDLIPQPNLRSPYKFVNAPYNLNDRTSKGELCNTIYPLLRTGCCPNQQQFLDNNFDR